MIPVGFKKGKVLLVILNAFIASFLIVYNIFFMIGQIDNMFVSLAIFRTHQKMSKDYYLVIIITVILAVLMLVIKAKKRLFTNSEQKEEISPDLKVDLEDNPSPE